MTGAGDETLLAFAGLWDNWRTPEGERLTTFTIITTTPNELLERLHDRMPVVLDPADYRTWLEADDPRALLKPPLVEIVSVLSQ